MKHEYKKNEKDIYGVKNTPTIIDLPKQNFICIDGVGNPNSDAFSKNVEVLYQLSYTIKMMPKNNYNIDGYFEYVVYPLEGLWSLTDKGIEIQKKIGELDKNEFKYTLMIKQPSFINEKIFNQALEIAKNKKPNKLLDNIYYKEVAEGLSCQILHNGSYDKEPISFNKIHQYLTDNKYKRIDSTHKEIYLSDARKVEPDRLKTILRVKISKN